MKDNLESRLRSEQQFHDAKYSSGEELYPAHYSVSPTAPIYADMLQSLGSLESKSVLEVGCGDGWCTVDLCRAGGQVEAFDISEEAVRSTRRGLAEAGLEDRSNVQVMPAEKLDYADNSFDVAFGFAILHHLQLDLAVTELRRVLKPGGIAIFAEPLQGNPLLRLYRRMTPQYRTPDEKPMLISEFDTIFAGFRSVDHEEYYLTGQAALGLLYLPVLRRLYPKAQSVLWRLDRGLMGTLPALGNWAWYSKITATK